MRYGNCRWVDIDGLDKSGVVAVVPLGSMEQHGHHLPLLVDTHLVTGVAEGVEARLPDKVYLTPTLWLGASDHHLDFPGTISVPNTVYTQMIMNLVRSLVRSGFERILLLNGHGGNVTPGTQAITELANSCDMADNVYMALSSYWTIAAPRMSAEQHGMESKQLSHACEYETSMMLHLHKDTVVMEAARGCDPTVESPFYHAQHLGRVSVAARFHRRTTTGAMGKPEAATAEKGASLLAEIVDEVSLFIEDYLTWKPQAIIKEPAPK